MEYALIKRYITRSSTSYLPRLTRASVHAKAEVQKGSDERAAAISTQSLCRKETDTFDL
jgi:hypothetical protein